MPQPWSWLTQTPIRAIEAAHVAALAIAQLEADYFDGQPVTLSDRHSPSVWHFLRGKLRYQLWVIRVRLAEYRSTSLGLTLRANPDILVKLTYIDQVQERYRSGIRPKPSSSEPSTSALDSAAAGLIPPEASAGAIARPQPPKLRAPKSHALKSQTPKPSQTQDQTSTENNIIPRSLVNTLGQIRQDLLRGPEDSSQTAHDLEATLTYQRWRAVSTLRFICLLALVAVLAQQGSRNFVFNPLVDQLQAEYQLFSPIAPALPDEAVQQFMLAQEKAAFQLALGQSSESPDLAAEARRIAQNTERLQLEGVKNGLADLAALLTVYLTLRLSQRKVGVLKDFLGSLWTGLGDSAKAFLIILATDLFVGYHSAEGWEALLLALSHHWGLPEERTLILSFIATFPVFIDALFKFWLFQYLRMSSPSTATIYREMGAN